MRFLLNLLLVLVSTPVQADDFDLVDIPAGLGQFGDPEGDDNEVVRQAQVPAFRLMRREVTNAQFKRFVAETGHETDVEKSGAGYVWKRRWGLVKGADWRHPESPAASIEELDDHPVVQVSKRDAEAFCRYYRMRLPNEDEWEYAARGSKGLRYPWGNELTRQSLPRLVNAGTWECCAPSGADGYARTSPVGSYPAGRSPFGLDDMIGNVWEWTTTPFPGRDGQFVIRGGGWGNNPYCLRAAYRHGNPPDIGLEMVGFRCAADAVQ